MTTAMEERGKGRPDGAAFFGAFSREGLDFSRFSAMLKSWKGPGGASGDRGKSPGGKALPGMARREPGGDLRKRKWGNAKPWHRTNNT